MNARLLTIAMCLLIGTLAVIAYAAGQQEAAAEPGLDLTDKVLLVYQGSEDSYLSSVLVEPTFRELKGRMFLSGTFADVEDEEEWRAGMPTEIAWDTVTSFHVLTKEQFQEYLEGIEVEF